MALSFITRWSINTLASISARRATLPLPRPSSSSLFPRFYSKTASSSTLDTEVASSPPNEEDEHPSFPLNFFSSIKTLDEVNFLLTEARSHLPPPPELSRFFNDPPPPTPAERHTTHLVSYLTRASALPNAAARSVYLKQLDLLHRPLETLIDAKKEKARQQVLKGYCVEEDALPMAEWEARELKKREKVMEGKLGAIRKEAGYQAERKTRRDRVMTLLRREVRAEPEQDGEEALQRTV